MSGLCRSWDKVKIEIEKCELLCANCHREQHVEEKMKKEHQEFLSQIPST
jgi:hypothetical protein